MSVTDLPALEAFLAEPRNAIVIGLRKDGRAHATPNWFLWEDGRFYVSTTRGRAKYRVFTNDGRAQLVIDDSTGFRYVIVEGTVEVSEDLEGGLGFFERLRAKHGRGGQSRDDLRAEMERDGRVLLVLTPSKPPADWPAIGF
jgi:PPOX class probable F420-dependent enzyme